MNRFSRTSSFLVSALAAGFTAWQVIQYVFIPEFSARFDLSLSEIAFLFGASSLLFLMANLLWPKVIGSLGIKFVFITGCAGLIISQLLLVRGLETSVSSYLYASRLLYGVFVSSLATSTLSWRLSLAREDEKTLFAHSQALNIGRVAGPLFIAVTGFSGATTSLVCAATMGIVLVAVCVSPMGEVKLPARSEAVRLPGFLPLFFLSLGAAAYLGLVQTSLGEITRTGPSFLSRLFLLSAVTSVILQAFGGMWVRYSASTLLIAGLVATAAGTFLLLRSEFLYASIILISSGLALVHPNLNRLAVGKVTGTRTGLLSGSHVLGHALGTTLAGVALSIGLSWVTGAILLTLFILLFTTTSGRDSHVPA